MFESIEKDQTSILGVTLRSFYLLFAVLVNLPLLYVLIFPEAATDYRWEYVTLGWLIFGLSLILSAPIFIYVVWKLVKRERPIFWAIALLLAAFPFLYIIAFAIFR